MFTLSPGTTHRSLAVSPSGTVTAGGRPVIVSSPRHEKTSWVATTDPSPSRTPLDPTQDFLLTQNSELDPALVSVLPIESNTAIEATVLHSHSADDQRAIRLHLVPGDQTQPVDRGSGGAGVGRRAKQGPYRSVCLAKELRTSPSQSSCQHFNSLDNIWL